METIKLIKADKSNYSTRTSQTKIKYLVIHYTANNGDTALGNCKYFQGANRNASAHYFVDETSVFQSVEDKYKAWHCGSENGKYIHPTCRNDNSIGIELCSRKKGLLYYFEDNTINNAIELIKSLMVKYNIPQENVIRHFDVTGKLCPAPLVLPEKWTEFKNKLKKEEYMVTKTKIIIDGKEYEVSRILQDNKNYIELREFQQAGYTVDYDAEKKLPIFKK